MDKPMNDVHQKPLFLISNSFFVTAFILIIQLIGWGGFYYLVSRMDHGSAFAFRLIVSLLTISMVGYIILRCKNNSYQVAWLILLALVPAAALVFYVIIRLVPGTAHLTAQIYARKQSTDLHLEDSEVARRDLSMLDSRYVGLYKYLNNACKYPTYYSEGMTYYPTGEEAIDALLDDLKKAQHFIFMEYFIVSEGRVMDQVLDVLQAKVAEGVEVRFMYDGFCGLKLPKNYCERINAMGIQCAVFSPIRPVISSYQNNRDHRKITVIDGRVAYTGGFNLADEYANLIERFGYWKDAGLRVTGNGVQSLTAMFLQAWGTATGQKNDAYGYYMAVPLDSNPTRSIIAPYADAPENDRDTASDVYCQMLDLAEDYVHIMSPYLILDERMRTALEFAAERGIDVRIILPHIPDKKIVFMIARSYYPELLESGIKVYEFTPGFLHTKLFVSDDCISSVGTINPDYRSLFLHFENSVLAYDHELAHDVEADFQKTMAQSQRIYLRTYCEFPWVKRAFGRLMRVFGPLM